MTREDINKHWEIIEAFKEGKKIQVKKHDGIWHDIDNPTFFYYYNYRVKSEKEHIPFEWEDREILRGRWIKNKKSKVELLITAFNNDSSGFIINGFYAKYLLENYVFLDETPFGKLKQ